MEVKAIFGANLKLCRKQKCLSQEEMARKIDISPNHLSKIERGIAFVSAPLLDRIVCVLELAPADLFYTPEGKRAEDDRPTVESVVEEMEKTLATIKGKLGRPERCGH
jgi:transcriptional regulator with XRE-family HTH domain